VGSIPTRSTKIIGKKDELPSARLLTHLASLVYQPFAVIVGVGDGFGVVGSSVFGVGVGAGHGF
jgi:hypothetical protein